MTLRPPVFPSMKAAALLCLAVPLFAGTYKAQIGPYDAATISAEASGRIVKLDLRDEMRTVNDKVVIEIDHALDDIRLKNLKSKLRLLREQIDLKKAQYDSIRDLKSQNRFTKDQYRTQLLTLKMQADDLRSAIAQLEDTIAKKRFRVRGKYIKRFYVRKGEYVAPGVKLMRLEDHSGGRIVLVGSINGARGKFGQTAYARTKEERDRLQLLHDTMVAIEQATTVEHKLGLIAEGLQNVGYGRVALTLRDAQMRMTHLVTAGMCISGARNTTPAASMAMVPIFM